MLTERKTRDAKAVNSKPIFLWDHQVRGLGVKITPAGTRSYVLNYRVGGARTPGDTGAVLGNRPARRSGARRPMRNVTRCTWRLRSADFRAAHAGRRVSGLEAPPVVRYRRLAAAAAGGKGRQGERGGNGQCRVPGPRRSLTGRALSKPTGRAPSGACERKRVTRPVRLFRGGLASHRDEFHPVSRFVHERRLAVKVEQGKATSTARTTARPGASSTPAPMSARSARNGLRRRDRGASRAFTLCRERSRTRRSVTARRLGHVLGAVRTDG